MAECPTCLGEGGHDFRQLNAWLRARRAPRSAIGPEWVGCYTCWATGQLPAAMAADMAAAARAQIDQIAARLADGAARARLLAL